MSTRDLRFLSFSVFFFRRTTGAQTGQYFPRLDFGTKSLLHIVHRFIADVCIRLFTSVSFSGNTAQRNHLQQSEAEIIWAHTSSSRIQFPLLKLQQDSRISALACFLCPGFMRGSEPSGFRSTLGNSLILKGLSPFSHVKNQPRLSVTTLMVDL